VNSLKRRSDLWLQTAASVNTGILRVKKEGQRMLEKTNVVLYPDWSDARLDTGGISARLGADLLGKRARESREVQLG